MPTTTSGYWQQRRAQQQLQWLDEAVRENLAARFYGQAAGQAALPALRQTVALGQLTPWAAAGELLGR